MNRGPYPHTQVVRVGILAALAQGPATCREIEARMGVRSGRRTHDLMLGLERDGQARRIGFVKGGQRRPPIVWDLTQPHKEHAA